MERGGCDQSAGVATDLMPMFVYIFRFNIDFTIRSRINQNFRQFDPLDCTGGKGRQSFNLELVDEGDYGIWRGSPEHLMTLGVNVGRWYRSVHGCSLEWLV